MALVERERLLHALRDELEFLEGGEYSHPTSWRPFLIFEDSPICKVVPNSSCSEVGCALLGFVPVKDREAQTPCRHIVLNRQGETVDSFYRTGTNEELQTAVRDWLRARIKELEC